MNQLPLKRIMQRVTRHRSRVTFYKKRFRCGVSNKPFTEIVCTIHDLIDLHKEFSVKGTRLVVQSIPQLKYANSILDTEEITDIVSVETI